MNNNRIEQLIERARVEPVNYLYFWGHSHKDCQIGKACLSQWFGSSFKIGEVEYASAEQYMMAEKARLFDDQISLGLIMDTKSPSIAKEIGRRVHNFDALLWEERCFDIVVEGNLAKFSQNAFLQDFLFRTEDDVLVEASPYDKIWGVGMAADDPRITDPARWKGLNLLGFALMEVRTQLLNCR